MISRRELLAGTAAVTLVAARGPAKFRPPVTPKDPLRIEQLGRVRVDPYAWLKPKNWKEVWRNPSVLDPQILAYLQEENRYCDAVLQPTELLQAELVEQM